jgi:hypothetical protein
VLLGESAVSQRLSPARRLWSAADRAAFSITRTAFFLPGRRDVLADVDRLKHGCDLAHLGRRHMAEDGAVPVHDGVLEEAAITSPGTVARRGKSRRDCGDGHGAKLIKALLTRPFDRQSPLARPKTGAGKAFGFESRGIQSESSSAVFLHQYPEQARLVPSKPPASAINRVKGAYGRLASQLPCNLLAIHGQAAIFLDGQLGT